MVKDLETYVDSKYQIFEINKLNEVLYFKFIKLTIEYGSLRHKYHTNLDI